MNRLIALILALILSVFCFAGCGSKNESTEIANPYEKVESLDVVNEKVGTTLHAPEGLTVEGESFYVIHSDPAIAHYKFEHEGITYTLRAGFTKEDFSGLYLEEGTFGEICDQTGNDTVVYEDGQCTRWFEGDVQFILHSDNTDADTSLMTVRDALK